ncbi:hypothetical protein PVAP13_8NG278700 [Panicum virgatum]|uniref:Uncharacterized protein n=1 Tax=Panicum virgatum TaxID=38727 RepID=A0A8T0PCE0_PANVG|nr:hypothetical protein PVAP13_8NG278700 [Panicum virgatum]
MSKENHETAAMPDLLATAVARGRKAAMAAQEWIWLQLPVYLPIEAMVSLSEGIQPAAVPKLQRWCNHLPPHKFMGPFDQRQTQLLGANCQDSGASSVPDPCTTWAFLFCISSCYSASHSTQE